jgi:hypothetical protein
VRPEQAIQPVEHDPRLDPHGARGRVELDHLGQMLGVIDDQAGADRLTRLRGAAPARRHRHAELACERQRGVHVGVGPGHHHGLWLDLIDRGIGAVATSVERLEQHVARDLAPKAFRQGGIALLGIQATTFQGEGHA